MRKHTRNTKLGLGTCAFLKRSENNGSRIISFASQKSHFLLTVVLDTTSELSEHERLVTTTAGSRQRKLAKTGTG